MSSIFPMIDPPYENQTPAAELPLCREVAWDYAANVPIFRRGEPVEVTGREAVKVWVYKALTTPRARHEIYTRAYGSELEELIGQAYTSDLKQAEAGRYLRECLSVNPYITQVAAVTAEFEGGRLTVGGRIETIYGEVDVNVTV